MSLPAYSSLEAFFAHYRLLRAARVPAATAARPASPANPSDAATLATPASPSNPTDAATLAEMERIIGELSAADQIALKKELEAEFEALGWSHPAARHRARAELHLRRLLVARGLLAG
jgi:hypothetical protein